MLDTIRTIKTFIDIAPLQVFWIKPLAQAQLSQVANDAQVARRSNILEKRRRRRNRKMAR